MNIVFAPTAWEQYTDWQREDKKMAKRINELIKDIHLMYADNIDRFS